MQRQFLNRIELLNELLALGLTYFLPFFTNWCSDVEVAYQVAEILMYYVAAILLINIMLLLHQMAQPLLLRLRRWNYRRNLRKAKERRRQRKLNKRLKREAELKALQEKEIQERIEKAEAKAKAKA